VPVAPRTPPDSPFRRFIGHGLNCGSFKVRVLSKFDDEAGEVKLILFCPQCREREQTPVR